MEAPASELMERRPVDARPTADVAGPGPLVQARGPALVLGQSTVAQRTRHGPPPGRPQLERIGTRRDTAVPCDAPALGPVCLRRFLVP